MIFVVVGDRVNSDSRLVANGTEFNRRGRGEIAAESAELSRTPRDPTGEGACSHVSVAGLQQGVMGWNA